MKSKISPAGRVGAVILTAAAAVASVAWIVAGSRGSASSSTDRIPASEIVAQTIVIREGLDDGAGRVVFAPPPDGSLDEALTAGEALDAFKSVNPEYTAADKSTPQLGSFTASSGPDTYRFQDQLAWGFSTMTTCPPSPNPYDAQSPSSECTDWLFLDAHTGEMLEEDFQPVTSSS